MGREKIREDLKRYDERWPERHFWLAGDVKVEPENDNRMRVTFPLRDSNCAMLRNIRRARSIKRWC